VPLEGLGNSFIFTPPFNPPPPKKKSIIEITDSVGHGLIILVFAICLHPAQYQAPLPHFFIMFQKIYLKPAKSAYSSRSKFRRVVEALRLCHAGALEGAWKLQKDGEPNNLRPKQGVPI